MTHLENSQLKQALYASTSKVWSGENPFTLCETCGSNICFWCVDCNTESCGPCSGISHEGCSMKRMQEELYSFRTSLTRLDPALKASKATCEENLAYADKLRRSIEQNKAELTNRVKQGLRQLVDTLNDFLNHKNIVHELFVEMGALETLVKQNLEFWAAQKKLREETTSLLEEVTRSLNVNVVKRDEVLKANYERCKAEIEQFVSKTQDYATQEADFKSSSDMLNQKIRESDPGEAIISWISDKVKTRLSSLNQQMSGMLLSLSANSAQDLKASGSTDRNLIPLMQNLDRKSGSGGSD